MLDKAQETEYGPTYLRFPDGYVAAVRRSATGAVVAAGIALQNWAPETGSEFAGSTYLRFLSADAVGVEHSQRSMRCETARSLLGMD